MDFFQAQDHARRSTGLLVAYFGMAVLSLVILTNLLVMFFFGYLETQSLTPETLTPETFIAQFDWRIFGTIGVVVIAVVALGSLYKILALSSGGAGIAEMMGGELIVDGSGDFNRQKVLNVVEEMAIASGTPVPPVYLLDEEGINAFAAGYKPGDAIIAVTRGSIEQLDREQLQGVIAHEFSHILNGDMRLNIRLIGILHGILIIGIIGYYLLRSSSSSRGVRSRSRNNGGAGAILGLGLGLMAIGYTGTFFGNLIKAAVSRQREYLADASAVQFTRNPTGISGALKKIGGSASGSLLDNPHASELSHAYFSQGVKVLFRSLFATHPPLAERIRRIDPAWDGRFVATDTDSATPTEHPENTEDSGKRAFATSAAVMAASMEAIDHIGRPTSAHIEYAQQLVQALPATLLHAAHEPHGARAVIYLLVLSSDPAVRKKQLEHLQIHADAGVYEFVIKLCDKDHGFELSYRLPLLDIAISTLRQLSPQQYQLFNKNLNALIKADNKIELFEWALQKIVYHHLDEVFIKRSPVKSRYHSFSQVQKACRILFSVIVHSGPQHDTIPEAIFANAMGKLGLEQATLLSRDTLSLPMLNSALQELNQLKVLMKPQLLKACATCITADQKISTLESELLRAISDILDCPMPPLLL